MADRTRMRLDADNMLERRPAVDCDRVRILRLGVDVPARHRRAVVAVEIGGRMERVRVPRRAVRAEKLLAVRRPNQRRDRRVQANGRLGKHGVRRIDTPETYDAFRVSGTAGENIWLPGTPGQSLRDSYETCDP